MTWSLLINALVQLFLPLAQKWLEDLFKRIQDRLNKLPDDPAVAVHDVFSAARGELSWWQFRKRRVLEAAQRIATKRAAELVAAARDGVPVAALSGAEHAALLDAE
jgi:hypothetical protein